MTMETGPNQSKPRVQNATAIVQALVAEIWMLVDFIAGSSTEGLAKVQVAKPAMKGVVLDTEELLQLVSEAERRLDEGQLPQVNDRAFMQIVRDELNLVVHPASGLSIAYSTLVAGPSRKRSASRINLAGEAYANLVRRAVWHRWVSYGFLGTAVLFTGLAVWESAKVSLGKALLQNMDLLRTQQITLSAEKLKLEMSQLQQFGGLVAPESGSKQRSPLSSYRLCDRAYVTEARRKDGDIQKFISQQTSGSASLMLAYDTPEERDICGRDTILRTNIGIVHDELTNYSQNWPGMVGSGFAVTRDIAAHVGSYFYKSEPVKSMLNEPPKIKQDIEFRIAPVLLVWGNFILPIIFGLIGSIIFVTLDHYNKVRDSLLHPRDLFLAPVRLVLGLVVGACVGLFFSAYGPMPNPALTTSTAALVSSLTLTASGIAFLAGFGVETVFTMMQATINRIFVLPSK